MRPDLDEFEMNDDAAPRSRAMSWLVLVVAVGGFTALAYYAYHSGSQSVRDGNVLVVQADQNPIKGAPADAGGEQFPNKDKTIYDAMGAEGQQPAKVEKLLPEPEQPVIPEPPVSAQAPGNAGVDTTTFVSKSLKDGETAADPVDTQSMKQAPPPVAPESQPAAAKAAVVATAPVVAAKPVAAPAPKPAAPVVAKPAATAPVTAANDEDSEADDSEDNTPVAATPVAAPEAGSAPQMVNVKPAKAAAAPVAETKVAAKPAAKAAAKTAAKPVAKAVPAAASGSYKIQLGAYKSEAEAKQEWAKIAAKNSDVIKSSPVIAKAALPNGTYYRLRASGYASDAAAKAACTKLASRKQACFYAGK